ncbi:hypothetical protein MMC08_007365 [Hypocenomyce scalaris]|nr:hypothetical protein [Hypocenomyce scalaris]
MVELIERHGEWREQQVNNWLRRPEVVLNTIGEPESSPYSRELIYERARWKRDEEKLLYWGASYGSILGATFAAMQPHRVKRVVVDGVADAPDYYRGDWLKNLQDTDIILDRFCEYCYRGGPERCALYTGTSPQAIKVHYKNVVASIKTEPVAVPASSTRGPEIITWSDVKLMVREAIYRPMERFEQMAELLADLSHRNGSAFADYKQQGRNRVVVSPKCREAGLYSIECQGDGISAENGNPGILCTDGESLENMTQEAYRTYWRVLQGQSELIGDSWAQIRLACIGWNIRPKWRFGGPIASNTAHPLLFIGNTWDPVTPLRNAHNMARGFNGSVVLQQDSEGHCSYAFPSLCTAKTVRRYFQTGELPKPGTVCDPDRRPFLNAGRNEWELERTDLSSEDRILMDTLRQLAVAEA